MSKVAPLILFGFGLIVGGMYWMLFDSTREYFNPFIIRDVYYVLMEQGWRFIPAIILFVGIMCLISAGISASKTRVEV